LSADIDEIDEVQLRKAHEIGLSIHELKSGLTELPMTEMV
jgi:hypothetical protein